MYVCRLVTDCNNTGRFREREKEVDPSIGACLVASIFFFLELFRITENMA